jgi:uracil-DNA glycosylase family 4
VRRDPRTLRAKCSECPFACEGKPQFPVLGMGPPPEGARGVLVGESPGQEEARVGEPFRGATGQQLDEELSNEGLARTRLFIVNAIACKPTLKTEDSMGKAMKACLPAFRAQMAPYLAKKTPLFVMGKWAWRGLMALEGRNTLPKGGLDRGRGFIRETAQGGRYIATWHPTYAFFRQPFEWGAFAIDLNRFARLLRGRLRPAPEKLVTNATWRDIQELLRSAPVQRRAGLPGTQNLAPIGVDIECGPRWRAKSWTALNPYLARLRTIGLGNAHWGLSFRWERADSRTRQAVQDLFRDPRYILVDQNGDWYDWPNLGKHGFVIPNRERRFSIRDGRHAIMPQSPLHLGYMGAIYDDPIPWKEEDEEDDKGLVTRAPRTEADWDALMAYNAQDAVEQCRISGPGGPWKGLRFEAEWAEVRVQRLYDINRQKSELAAEMYRDGIGVDQAARKELSDFLAAEYERRLSALVKAVGLPKFTGSPNDLRSLLFHRHETEDIRMFSLPNPWREDQYTETGLIAVNQRSLIWLCTDPGVPKEAKQLIRMYWEANAVRKSRNTFVASEDIERAIGSDDRLRPGWNSLGAETGRWSCRKPNIMTLNESKE